MLAPSPSSLRRSISPSSSTPRIRFEEGWLASERCLFENAIGNAERIQHSWTTQAIPESWFCYCKRFSGLSVYGAHQAGRNQVLRACSTTESDLKMECFGSRLPNGPGGFTARGRMCKEREAFRFFIPRLAGDHHAPRRLSRFQRSHRYHCRFHWCHLWLADTNP